MVKKNIVKGLALFLALLLGITSTSLGPMIAFAEASPVASEGLASLSIQQRVIPTGSHKASVVLTLNSGKAYSSADFILVIEGPATLVQLDSKLPASAQFVGPVLKEGHYHFGFFSSTNQFQGNQQIAVLNLQASGQNPIKVTLKSASTTAVGKVAGDVTKTVITAQSTLELTRSAGANVNPGNPNPPGTDSNPGNNTSPGNNGNQGNSGNKPVSEEDLVTLDGEPVPLGDMLVTFLDTQNSWAMAYIHSLASFGLIKGKGANLFKPQDHMTRAEFVHLLMTVYSEKVNGTGTRPSSNIEKVAFVDVPQNAYYQNSLARAVALKVVTDASKKFLPNEKITRQEMMVMLHNVLRASGYTFTVKANLNIFVDQGQISPYARPAVSELVGAGIITGNGKAIQPKGLLKREEAAKVIYEFRAKTQ